MQQARESRQTIRPLVLLISVLGFLVVYLGGLIREHPLFWVSVSSASALVVLLIAGLAIDHLLDRPAAGEDPAAVYERPSEQRTTPHYEER